MLENDSQEEGSYLQRQNRLKSLRARHTQAESQMTSDDVAHK